MTRVPPSPRVPRLVWWLRLLSRFPVTVAIFVATAAMFAVQHGLGVTTDPDVYVRLGALVPERVREHGELYRLLTPMLLHHGWIHFGLNMFAFLQLGMLTEFMFGRYGLLFAYVLSGVGAALCTTFLAASWVPASVGASGAILGLAGLLLGTSWFGVEPWRSALRRVLGRSLIFGVAITFAFGLGIGLIVPLVDNWGHTGGLVTGLLLAAGHRLWAPRTVAGALPPPPRALVSAAAVAVAVWIVSVAHMVNDGAEALDTYDRDAAAGLEARALHMNGGIRSAMAIARAADILEQADLHDDTVGLLHRSLPHLKRVDHYVLVAMQLDELGHHAAALEVAEVLLDHHDDADALNMAAWQLVSTPDEALRDPVRAASLSRRSLDVLGDASSADDRATWREQRAAYLDTLAEAMIQQGRYAEAEPLQREAVRIATEDDLSMLDEVTARLARIEEALGHG